MKPLVYQADGLDKLEAARKRGRKKLLVVMATGLGKTVVAGFELERLLEEDPGRVLFLSHDTRINAQGRETYEEMFGDKYTHGNFNGEEKHLHRVDFLYATFQTMANHRQKFGRREFKYIVIDESHHLMAETFYPTVEYFIPKLFLGLTATPERSDGLDITDFFGEPVINLGLFKALAKGYLCEVDYRLMTDEIQSLDVLDTPAGKISIAELNRRLFIPKRDEEMVRLIAEKSAAVKNPRTIIFCASVQHAENLAKLIPESVVLHSKVKGKKERKRRLDAFRSGEAKTILTVDMLNEGINVPEANIIVFARSTASRRIYLQELGRGLRWAEGKVLLVLDFVANCERIEWIDEVLAGAREEADDEWDDPLASEGREGGWGSRMYGPSITLTIEGGEFDERLIKLFKVVRRIRNGYTREELISQLHELAAALGGTPRVQDVHEAAKTGNCASMHHYLKVFGGTFNDALRAAGFKLNNEQHTKEGLIKQLKQLVETLGHNPTQVELNAGSKEGICAPYSAYRNYFGGLPQALEQAGLAEEAAMPTRDEMLEALRGLAVAKGGSRITKEDVLRGYREGKCPSGDTYKAVFGTFGSAFTEAGLASKKHSFTEAELIELLKGAVRQRNVVALNSTSFAELCEANEMPSTAPYKRKFGGLRSAAAKAGIPWDGPGRPTKEEGLVSLGALAERLGKTPATDDINEASKQRLGPSVAFYQAHWGSLDEALEAAGIELRTVTDEELLDKLCVQQRLLGRRLKVREFDVLYEEGKLPRGSATYRRRFNGNVNATRLAGGYNE